MVGETEIKAEILSFKRLKATISRDTEIDDTQREKMNLIINSAINALEWVIGNDANTVRTINDIERSKDEIVEKIQEDNNKD